MKFRIITSIALAFLVLMGCDNRTPTVSDKDAVKYQLHVSTDRDVIYADNGKTLAKITAWLADEDGIAQSGSQIVFFPSQGKMAASGTTDQTGRANSYFDDSGQSTTADSPVRIIAQFTDSGSNIVRDTVYVEVLPMEALVDTFFVDTKPIDGIIVIESIDESASVTVSSHVFDANGVPVENVEVNYRVISDESGLGYITSPSDSTNGAGVSSTEFFTNAGRLGVAEVEAYITTEDMSTLMRNNPGLYTFNNLGKGAANSAALTATATIEAVASNPFIVDIQTQDVVIYADQGTTTARINAFLRDSQGNALPEMTINFLSDLGTVTSTATTNESGLAEAVYSDLGTVFTQDSIATIFARIEHPFHGLITDSVSVSILTLDPSNTVRFHVITNPVNGETTVSNVDSSYASQIIAYVRNDNGVALPGVDVTFRIVTGLELGYLNESVVVSDSTGLSKASFILNPGVTGAVSVEASVRESDTLSMAETVDLNFLPMSNYSLDVYSVESSIYADNGETVAQIVSTVRDLNGNPIEGASVYFSANEGSVNSPQITNDAGVAITTFSDVGTVFTADKQVEIEARVNHPYHSTPITDEVEIEVRLLEDQSTRNFYMITSPPGGNILLEDLDSAYVAVFNAQLRDNRGVALPNVTVDFRVTAGSGLGYLSNANSVTDSAGAAYVTFTSNPGMDGTVTVEAFINGDDSIDPISKDVAFVPLTNYEINAFTYQDVIYYDNGLTTARVYAVVRDMDGNALDSVAVRFSSDIGTVPSLVWTNNAGIAETEFSDLGAAGPEDATATITARVFHPFHGLTSSTVQVQIEENDVTPDKIPAFIDMIASYTALPDYDDPDSTVSRLHLTVTDTLGFPVDEGTEVIFSTDIGNITPFALTNGDGIAKANFTMGDSSGLAKIYARSGMAIDSVLILVRPSSAAYLIIPPVNPNYIVVQGGWGAESTTLSAEIRDSRGELVDSSYAVTFRIEPAPSGANLDGVGPEVTVESNFGIASVTLNAGIEPGPVQLTVSTQANGGSTIYSTGTPVIIRAGLPAHINADIDINAITPVGGGFYELEAAALVWDQHTNPVEDSTMVYWSVIPDTICNIIGESYTNNENLSGDSYHGMAWTKLYFNSGVIFDTLQIVAKTWGAPGDTVLAYVNADADSTQILPFFPGTLTVSPSIAFYDFQLGASPVRVVLTAYLADHYANPIFGGRIQFAAIGGAGWEDLEGNAMDVPVVRTNEQGIAQIVVLFDEGLCIPNYDTGGEPTGTYDPFTATVWGSLIDPQPTTSEQMTIELIKSPDPD